MIEITKIDNYAPEENYLVHYMEVGCTVNDLRKLMKHVGFEVHGKPRKHELVKMLSEYLLNNVKDILDIFPLYDLMLLKDLVNAGENGVVVRRFNHIYPLIAIYSLVGHSYKKDDTVIKYVIPEDLRLALKKNFETYKPTNDDVILWEYKQAAEGLVNLYGWVPLDELTKQMRRLFPMDSTTDIVRGLASSLSLREYTILHEGKDIFYSPFYLWNHDINPVPRERLKYNDIEYRQFSLSEADTAGNAFFHGYENEEERELHELLVNVAELSDEDANAITELIWRNVGLSCGFPVDVTEYLRYWIDPDKFPTIVTAAKSYKDSVPCWHLKGHTPQEVFDIRYHSKSRPQTNTLFPYSRVTSPIVNTMKIRPNDPCPCGSGKKYKKCCGKNR